MREQVHETCGPILPEDVPDDLVELFSRSYLEAGLRCGAVRAGLAAVLTEVGERIAQAVLVELAEKGPDDMLLITRHGELAAAVIRSWPEGLDD